MNLKAKRKLESDNQKEKRKEAVIEAAIEVFKKNGIDNTKMTDVAEKAEIGVATVYRYFKTKKDLVTAAATWLWKEEISILYDNFYEETFKGLKGVDKVRKILSLFIDMYEIYPHYISFLENFDNYIIKEKISIDELQSYEQSLIDIKEVMFKAIDEGKKDGSIKEKIENEVFYMTITHALMSLCQKLISRGMILKSDSEIKGEAQINLLIDMAINYLNI